MSMPSPSDERRWCVVTGASAGIGRAVAEELLAQGFCVVGVARSSRVLAELTGTWPQAFVGVAHDVAHAGLPTRLARLGVPLDQVELVVHSAGCARQGQPLTDMADLDIQEVVATNVLGTTVVVRDFAGVLLRRGAGTLVVLGSVASQDAAPLMAAYAASKAYVQQLVRCIRSDLHGSGVRVTCLHPGTTRTGLLEGQPGLSAGERFAGFTPLEAADLAKAICWIHQQPPHVNVQEATLFPVAQSLYVRGVHRQAPEARTPAAAS
jgi:NADP-dependent 3-hydroxy acid dehydrogenase YdfG